MHGLHLSLQTTGLQGLQGLITFLSQAPDFLSQVEQHAFLGDVLIALEDLAFARLSLRLSLFPLLFFSADLALFTGLLAVDE